MLARSFQGQGFPVVIHDVVSAETAALYRQELSAHTPRIVLLLPTFEAIVRRNLLRPPRLTTEQLRALYRQQETFADHDHTLDNTTLSPETVAERLLTMRAVAPFPP